MKLLEQVVENEQGNEAWELELRKMHERHAADGMFIPEGPTLVGALHKNTSVLW